MEEIAGGCHDLRKENTSEGRRKTSRQGWQLGVNL